jgi:hypothetical protein
MGRVEALRDVDIVRGDSPEMATVSNLRLHIHRLFISPAVLSLYPQAALVHQLAQFPAKTMRI